MSPSFVTIFSASRDEESEFDGEYSIKTTIYKTPDGIKVDYDGTIGGPSRNHDAADVIEGAFQAPDPTPRSEAEVQLLIAAVEWLEKS